MTEGENREVGTRTGCRSAIRRGEERSEGREGKRGKSPIEGLEIGETRKLERTWISSPAQRKSPNLILIHFLSLKITKDYERRGSGRKLEWRLAGLCLGSSIYLLLPLLYCLFACNYTPYSVGTPFYYVLLYSCTEYIVSKQSPSLLVLPLVTRHSTFLGPFVPFLPPKPPIHHPRTGEKG